MRLHHQAVSGHVAALPHAPKQRDALFRFRGQVDRPMAHAPLLPTGVVSFAGHAATYHPAFPAPPSIPTEREERMLEREALKEDRQPSRHPTTATTCPGGAVQEHVEGEILPRSPCKHA